ncbi:hypothetical protein F1B92_04515 [Campylobacter sp. FMV-PI01]|uniref:HK97 gp10 family phage protein n=1 Tax=Campylobacter portucalensis TaxID=2608384 RepID=A0A6L5WKS0_9BACT|nr:hypothetical protein [Campylobacter portucalensis]MSN96443.1 hypothetical protein [Campylobacter portucalensis]
MEIKKLSEEFLYKIGIEVSNLAKQKTAPILTGNLKRDISVRSVSHKEVTIGNTKITSYAKFVHYGTGVYGPKKAKIRAKKAKALKTPYGYKKSIKGQKANPYLENALDEYRNGGGLDRAVKSFGNEIGKKIKADIEVRFKQR